MRNRLSLTTILLVLALAITGCARTVEDYDIQFEGQQDVPLSDLAKRIENAGQKENWQFDWPEQTHAIATWQGRSSSSFWAKKFTIVVDIRFDRGHARISYRDSARLGYDGKKINRLYPNVVTRLAAQIERDVRLVAPVRP